jgi:hypothetical protein
VGGSTLQKERLLYREQRNLWLNTAIFFMLGVDSLWITWGKVLWYTFYMELPFVDIKIILSFTIGFVCGHEWNHVRDLFKKVINLK